MGFPLASLKSCALRSTHEAIGRREAFPSPKSKTNLSLRHVGRMYDGVQGDLLGGIVVVRLDPLELDVDKVLRVQRAGQDSVWLDLFCSAIVVVLVQKVTTQSTADGQKVFRCSKPFGSRCFCGVKPGLWNPDECRKECGMQTYLQLSGPK